MRLAADVSPAVLTEEAAAGSASGGEWQSLIRELSSQYERRYQDEQRMKTALFELGGEEGRFLEEAQQYYAAKEKLGPGDAHLLLSLTGDAMYRSDKATIEAYLELLKTASGKTHDMPEAAELYEARREQLQERLKSIE